MICVTVIHNGRQTPLEAREGETLLAVLARGGFSVYAPCGGNGTCGKCLVHATGGLQGKKEGDRYFACQTAVYGDATVTLSEAALAVQTAHQAVSYALSPMVRSVRTAEKTLFYRENELLCEDAPGARNLGLAADIGTTTVALYLCDSDTGEILQARGFANPQRTWGADVISRVDKIMKDPAALELQKRALTDAINASSAEMLAAIGETTDAIRAAVLCGNTVMQHIVTGLDPSGIAVAPFTPVSLFGERYDASAIGLHASAGAKVLLAPCIASYVGGDITCGVVACGLEKTEKNVIFLDVGTNGEIALCTPNGIYFCSAAAGPAFEGAHIECGMPGTAGAVSEIAAEDGVIRFRTVDGADPVGICGSGILDGVAVMLEMGLLDETGCICDETDSPYLREDEEGDTVFFLGDHVYLTGKDIREVQLAKAAIAAGIRVLLHEARLDASDVDALVLAGGFGSHIRPESACRVGLIPSALLDRVTCVGNTAGAGAVALLLGEAPRKASLDVKARAHYTELSQNAFFMEAYVEEMTFEE